LERFSTDSFALYARRNGVLRLSRPFHGQVIILVNEHTASAGEMVAAFA
jgi:C-terminal processing protease CtpA/Prc